MVNLVANDVNRFDLVSIFIHHMWSAPLSTLIIAYFLYIEAGYAGLIGIAAVFVVVPIQCEFLAMMIPLSSWISSSSCTCKILLSLLTIFCKIFYS